MVMIDCRLQEGVASEYLLLVSPTSSPSFPRMRPCGREKEWRVLLSLLTAHVPLHEEEEEPGTCGVAYRDEPGVGSAVVCPFIYF